MADIETLHERLDAIEAQLETRPGEALDELTAVIEEMDGPVVEEIEGAERLVRNEDFPGTARRLGKSAVVLQRTATMTLRLRESIRRRR